MLHVGLICDFVEEGWPSMDLVGNMLFEQVRCQHAGSVAASRIRPVFQRRATAFNLLHESPTAWNADRLWNRMVEYPRWLRPRTANFDLFHIVDHSYSHLALELPRNRTIVTCHDLDAFRCLIEPRRDVRPFWFRRMTQRILSGLQRAAHVVFVSETVQQEAEALGIVARGRSSVIHNGVDRQERSEEAEREAGRLLASVANQPLLLNVGSTVPRKRIDLLLQIFASVRKRIPSVILVRAGGRLTEPQADVARQLGIEQSIVHLPFVRREVLAAVYRKSALLLQPTEAEGFGLPLIEAMICGCPVVASDLPVLRETGGEAAAYCPVGKVPEWTECITGLLQRRESGPADWDALRKRCVENASRFSWNKHADRVVSIYQNIISNSYIKRLEDQ